MWRIWIEHLPFSFVFGTTETFTCSICFVSCLYCYLLFLCLSPGDRLSGLVVRCQPSEWETQGLNPAFYRCFIPVTYTLVLVLRWQAPRVIGSVLGLADPDIRTLWLGEIASLIYNFFLSVASCTIVWADPSLSYILPVVRNLSNLEKKKKNRKKKDELCFWKLQ